MPCCLFSFGAVCPCIPVSEYSRRPVVSFILMLFVDLSLCVGVLLFVCFVLFCLLFYFCLCYILASGMTILCCFGNRNKNQDQYCCEIGHVCGLYLTFLQVYSHQILNFQRCLSLRIQHCVLIPLNTKEPRLVSKFWATWGGGGGGVAEVFAA